MKTSTTRLAALGAALLFTACSGVIDSKTPKTPQAQDPRAGENPVPTLKPGEAAPPLFNCDPNAVPTELALPRLSRAQLEGTLRFAIKLAAPTEADAIWSAVATSFASYPPDLIAPAVGDLKGGYGRADQAIQQNQVDTLYNLTIAIAGELTKTPARMTAMMGSCATDASTTNDATCLRDFVKKFGSRVLRYPLSDDSDASTDDDVSFYAAIAGTTPVDPAAVADVIATLLSAPEAVYRVEHGADADKAKPVAALTAPELAARLSLQFWQAPPDDALWAVAVNGTLLDPAVYQQQLDRMVKSPAVNSSVDEFVTQWLRLRELPPLDNLSHDAVFQAFAGAQMPNSGSRDAYITDVLSSAHAMLQGGGTVSDFLKDRHSYARDGFLAGVYGVPLWDGSSAAPLFNSTARAGLITRAGMLATGTAATRPIHKGYLVRNAILCQTIGPPPANANMTPPISSTTQTTRDAVTAKTGSGVCSGCHTTTINPPGFLTESFDALGRERSEERVFDLTGGLLASLPVNTAAVPQVSPGDMRSMSDAAELTQVIDETRLFHSCFARQYFRFSQSRYEVSAQDGCLLKDLEAAARSGGPLSDVLETAARAPTFKTRRFQ